jgi:hypothetical protein
VIDDAWLLRATKLRVIAAALKGHLRAFARKAGIFIARMSAGH